MKRFEITDFFDFEGVEGQFPVEFIKNNRCVKIQETDSLVEIACAESCIKENISRFFFGKKIRFLTVTDSEFSEFVGNIVESGTEGEQKSSERISLENISSSSAAVNIINGICLEAVRKNASDIHIAAEESGVRIRFRIDGFLQTVKMLNLSIFDSLVTRLKVMAGLNVAESRLPQDGSLRVVADNKNLDFRISILPCSTGNSVVLRLFDGSQKKTGLEELGFSERSLSLLKKVAGMKSGLVLVSGPTGSGKTTTLHSIIEEMDREHLKIMTIEDPVEKRIDGVEQIGVNEAIGLTFENILRRVLRQDPDVIMVGEIRDSETAALAVRAGLTGHLVLSTVHTKDSTGVIGRLLNLGVESYMISSVLKVSLAQRLVRKKCPLCPECRFTGWKGREAVSEVFEVDEKIQEMIEKKQSEGELKKYLKETGFVTMKEDGKNKVSSEITTMEEIEREVC